MYLPKYGSRYQPCELQQVKDKTKALFMQLRNLSSAATQICIYKSSCSREETVARISAADTGYLSIVDRHIP